MWAQLENKSAWVNDMLSGEEPSFEKKVRRLVKEELQNIQTGNY